VVGGRWSVVGGYLRALIVESWGALVGGKQRSPARQINAGRGMEHDRM
jgi:hypothetical protein